MTEKPLAEAVPAAGRGSLTRTVTWALPVVLMSRRSEARSASRAVTRETLEPAGRRIARGLPPTVMVAVASPCAVRLPYAARATSDQRLSWVETHAPSGFR